MNTIIVNVKDLDFEKYYECSSPFMFEEFNMILYTDDKKHRIKVRKGAHGPLWRVNDEPWIGMRLCADLEEIYPEKGIMTIELYDDGDLAVGEFYLSHKHYSQDEFEKIIEILSKEEGYKYFKDMASALASVLCVIMMMGKDERNRRQKQSNNNISIKKGSGKKTNDKVFLLKDIVNYISDHYIQEGGHHDIQCPCWEVRGHYRHYKSGKVVFVKSFKKGKNRATVEPKQKEYYV